jgi:Fe-S-cluster-containing hydrogenase component 2
MFPSVDKASCVGCGNCLRVCPAQAIKLIKGKAEVDYSLCQGCLVCLSYCPSGALRAAEPAKAEVPRISIRDRKSGAGHLSRELEEIRARLEEIKSRLYTLERRRS